MKKYLLRAAIAIAVLTGVSLLFIYSGIYNISAMEPHNKVTLWMINALKDNSIKHYSKDIKAPDLNNPSLVKTGFADYREMCAGCHGGPGLSRDVIGQGLYPMAPALAQSAKRLSPSELFWITKNGIKMTGMPAFGQTHSDDKIWALVSFLEKLPGMTKEQYEVLNKAVKEEGDE